jgi:hypothetical protein
MSMTHWAGSTFRFMQSCTLSMLGPGVAQGESVADAPGAARMQVVPSRSVVSKSVVVLMVFVSEFQT